MRRNHGNGRGTIVRTPDVEAWLVSTKARRGKLRYRAFETDLHDGRWLWMTETVHDNGWMLCIGTDITELRAEDRELRQDRDFARRAAETDELTGISNRRYVLARIEQMLRPEAGGSGCLALLDIDNFKLINDRFGHEAGDEVLRVFARCVQGLVRTTDTFGRIGGEEFVLVLPRTAADSAMLIVRRMLKSVQASRPLGPDFSYSFSAGIAAIEPLDTPRSILSRADDALYAAKRSGRSRVHASAAIAG
jgi:diguanylate cyclase (GGDEF)-like protein